MRLAGTLRSWNDGRGFGFIAPTHGGAEIFVHISALPPDGSRPTVGESVTYELSQGPTGKPQAVNVIREAVGVRLPRGVRPRPRRSFAMRWALAALVVTGGVAFVYRHFTAPPQAAPWALSAPLANEAGGAESPATAPTAFQCDGRTRCTQMTSCAEATYFLAHCPGVQMDGNHDGVPCEQQWCVGSR